MKKLISILFFFSTTFVFSQAKYLVPFRSGNSWGYSDTNLKIIVAPKYDYAEIYSYGFGMIVKGKLLGYLNANGIEIVPPIYEHISDFWKDYIVGTIGENANIINLHTGKVVLANINRNIFYNGNDIYIVTNKKGKKGVFNASKGSWLLSLEYDDITTDSFTTHFNYYTAKRKSELIHFSLSDKGRFSKLSTSSLKSVAIKEVKELPLIADEEKLDKIVEVTFVSNKLWFAGSFTENGKSGYYTKIIIDDVEIVDSVPAMFDNIALVPGNDSLLIVKRNGKEGVITLKNKEMVPAIYDTIAVVPGNDSLLIVKRNGREGVITIKNKEVIPQKYDEVKAVDSSYSHGIYIVKMNGKYGLAQDDTLLLACNYDAITQVHETLDYFNLMQNNKTGMYIFDKQKSLFNILIQPKYDYVLGFRMLQPLDFRLSDASKKGYKNATFLALVSKNGKRGYINLNGKEFFRN